MPFRLLVFALFTVSDVDTDLIAHWRFDEASGNTASEEISANNGSSGYRGVLMARTLSDDVGLVINEIHYDPEDKTNPVEYIEVYQAR